MVGLAFWQPPPDVERRHPELEPGGTNSLARAEKKNKKKNPGEKGCRCTLLSYASLWSQQAGARCPVEGAAGSEKDYPPRPHTPAPETLDRRSMSDFVGSVSGLGRRSSSGFWLKVKFSWSRVCSLRLGGKRARRRGFRSALSAKNAHW